MYSPLTLTLRLMLSQEKAKQRFWTKVNPAPSDLCWEWMACVTEKGYGKFNYLGKMARANRLAYIFAKGDIPNGKIVRHTCDNPGCCNPNHLILGTHKDNVIDAIKRNRRACHQGEFNNRSKLSDEQVRQIFLARGLFCDIAKEFNISVTHVSYIKQGKTRADATKDL